MHDANKDLEFDFDQFKKVVGDYWRAQKKGNSLLNPTLYYSLSKGWFVAEGVTCNCTLKNDEIPVQDLFYYLNRSDQRSVRPRKEDYLKLREIVLDTLMGLIREKPISV